MKKRVLFYSLVFVLIVISFILLKKTYHLVEVDQDLIIYTDDDYDHMENSCNKKACTYGLMDQNGKIYYKPRYHAIFILNNVVILIKENTIDVVNRNNLKESILTVTKDRLTDRLTLYQDDLIIQSNEGDYLIDTVKGDVNQVDRPYDYYTAKEGIEDMFTKDRARVVTKDDLWGFIDTSGKTVIQPIYHNVGYFNEQGYVVFEENHRFGLLDVNGNIHLNPVYESLFYTKGYYHAKLNEKYGLIDHEENEIIPFMYDTMYMYDDFIVVSKDNKYGIINLNHEVVTDFVYDQIYTFRDGYARFKQNDKYGIINQAGEIIIEALYEEIVDFSFEKNIALVKLNNKWGAINLNGEKVVDFIYDGIESNSIDIFDELIVFINESRYGLINYEGNVVVDFKYYSSIYQYGQWIKVELNDKIAIFDPSGKQLTEFVYDDMRGNIVKRDDKWGVINELGEEVIDVQYDLIRDTVNDYYIAEIEGKYGVIKMNEVIIDFDYQYIVHTNVGFVLEKNGHIYHSNLDGEISKIK